MVSEFGILIWIMTFVVLRKMANGYFVDHSENTEIIQQSVGSNITLQCSLKGLIDESQSKDIHYFWYFKQCGEGSGGTANCFDSNDDSEWTQLPCEDNFCMRHLQLKNVTEKYSGLYKCIVAPSAATHLDIRLVRTFQLDIKNSSQKIPELLDAFPLNKTVAAGGQAVFQCRVFSEEYPTIKWFRRLESVEAYEYDRVHSAVYYNGRAYELLTTSREKAIGPDVYLSKLILNDVRAEDEGFYACAAISTQGHSIREAYLLVPANDEEMPDYWSDYSEEESEPEMNSKTFWLLFLMPVGLALLPLSVWLCYVMHKRCRRHSDSEETANWSNEQLATVEEQRILTA